MTTGLLIIGVVMVGVVALRLFSKSDKPSIGKASFIGTMTIEDFVNKYNSNSGQVKGGSLCFFGHWFGRPYDNYHQLKSLAFDKERGLLIMDFNEGERLTIKNPNDIKEYKSQLTIETADKIYWTWYSYGNPQTEENFFFIDIEKADGQLTGKSNVNWYTPDFKDLSLQKPALMWT
jgi:hypothetical protein